MSDRKFGLGWVPTANGRLLLKSAGVTLNMGDAPLPASFSLSKFRLRHLEQGGLGTCHEHCAIQAFEVHTGADGTYEQVQLSRNMVGYQGQVLMAKMSGSRRGNPADGGMVTQDFLAMADEADGGVGVCHEALWPYPDDLAIRAEYSDAGGRQANAQARAIVGGTPPAAALADAALNRVHQISDVRGQFGDGWKRLLMNGHPIGIGISWDESWDAQGKYLINWYRPSAGVGHALTIIGYGMVDGQLAWQMDNWHGLLYEPLPAAQAAAIPGYKPFQPDKTSEVWVANSSMARAINNNSEAVTVAGLTGFKERPHLWDWSLGA